MTNYEPRKILLGKQKLIRVNPIQEGYDPEGIAIFRTTSAEQYAVEFFKMFIDEVEDYADRANLYNYSKEKIEDEISGLIKVFSLNPGVDGNYSIPVKKLHLGLSIETVKIDIRFLYGYYGYPIIDIEKEMEDCSIVKASYEYISKDLFDSGDVFEFHLDSLVLLLKHILNECFVGNLSSLIMGFIEKHHDYRGAYAGNKLIFHGQKYWGIHEIHSGKFTPCDLL